MPLKQEPRFHRALQTLRVPDSFWDSWTGKVLSCLFISALVASLLGPVEPALRRFVDSAVQTSLLQSLHDNPEAGCAAGHCVRVIGIDDEDYRSLFRQRSPLDPVLLLELVEQLRQAPPRVLAIDLDLSPADETDWPARQALLASLGELGKNTRVLMVCPKGFDAGNPGKLDQQWVEAAARLPVQFVSAAMSREGLYYDPQRQLPSLGYAAGRAAEGESAQAPEGERPLCQGTTEPPRDPGELRVIRPARTEGSSFAQAMAAPQAFKDHVVFLGGRWGTADIFWLRGVEDPVAGVTLHAWVAESVRHPPFEPPQALTVWVDIGVGMLFGALFAAIWREIVRQRHSFARRALLYTAFLGVATLVPLAYIAAAASLAEFGFVLGVAGMMISAAIDAFLSAQETVFEGEPGSPVSAASRWSAAGRWLALALAFGVLSALLLRLPSVAAWGATGAMLGIVAGWLDARAIADGPGHDAQNTESSVDLFARLAWLALRCGVLAWVSLNDFDLAAWVFVLGFFGVAVLARMVARR